jgi:adenylyltransferase/sulfurtransferase
MDEVSNAQFAKTFYSRQNLLKELGVDGQKKLAKARVAVMGVGGIGSVSSLYLALAGVGYIRVIDYDIVETHNLHRQILYTTDDLQQPKAEVAERKLQNHNPMISVESFSTKVTEGNIERLLTGVDCVVDGLDNMETRYIINRMCIELRIPYVFGAATGLEGNLSVFSPPETGCLECLMPQNSSIDQTSSKFGIIGATSGIIGTLQAMETIKLLAGIDKTLKGKLLVCDFSDMDFTAIPILKNAHCSVCGI